MTTSRRAHLVLRRLEEAFKDAPARARGAWVTTLDLQKAAGVGFKVGIHELHCKKKPEEGLGFVIARRWEEVPDGDRPTYGYMIVGYPLWWGKGGWDAEPRSEEAVHDQSDGAAGAQLGLPGLLCGSQ